MDWKKAGKNKADSVIALIPSEWRIPSIPSIEEQKDVTGPYIEQFLSAKEIEITNTDAVGIVQKTSSGAWTAVAVAKAFCHRAAIAHQLVNCLHEIFFDQALSAAEQLDSYYKSHGKPKGMLHGLPVSLKDQFHVKGVETHMGYIGWLDTFEGRKGTGKERKFESEMVRELQDLGAVLYCKTSVPHTLMCGETVNNIIGYTYNPKNRYLSSGGSSGGEGALIGARGSCVGFGTDIGGSIRIPSAFNGLYGLRPSTGRLPYEGMANSMDGQNSVLSVVGPLATTPGALKLVTQALLSQSPWLHDPLVHEIPWRPEQEKLPSKLAFGVFRNDGVVTPHPPVQRAVELVVAALQKAGHALMDWNPTPTHAAICETTYKTWGFDAGADLRDAFALTGEDVGQGVLLSDAPQQANATDIMRTNVEKRGMQKQYMDYWNSTESQTGTGRPVDAIVSPVAAFPAARKGQYTYYNYSVWVNMLDYTSVIVPVTTVDKSVDARIKDFKPMSEHDTKTMETYDPDVYDGAHVAIQIVGRRLQEEKMIAIAKYVGELLKQ